MENNRFIHLLLGLNKSQNEDKEIFLILRFLSVKIYLKMFLMCSKFLRYYRGYDIRRAHIIEN